MADNTPIKVLYYKTSSGVAHPFCFVDNELWTTPRELATIFDISNKKLKEIDSDIRDKSYDKSLFKEMTMSAKDFPEAGYSSGKITLLNASISLGIGYRITKDKAEHLNSWICKTLKKEGIHYPQKPDPDISACGRIYIQYGEMKEAIYNTDVYFENTYHPQWLQDPYVQKMIKDIDRATVLDQGLIQSPVLGMIPPKNLSGGVKTLILLYKDYSQVYNVSTCGDNCAKWILDMAKQRNLTINLHHIMDFGEKSFDAVILNNQKQVHSMMELVQYAGYYV